MSLLLGENRLWKAIPKAVMISKSSPIVPNNSPNINWIFYLLNVPEILILRIQLAYQSYLLRIQIPLEGLRNHFHVSVN